MNAERTRRFGAPRALAALAVGAVLAAPLALAGCWDHQEIENLAFVLAVGLDRDPATGLIQVTAQVAKPSAVATAGFTGAAASLERPTWLVTAAGRTTFEAVRNLARQSPRRIYWAHNSWIIFGEEAAREGVAPYLDYFTRQGQCRRLSNVLVVEGDTASSFLQLEFELTKQPSAAGLGLLKNVMVSKSTYIPSTVNDFLVALDSEGADPVMGRVQTIVKAEPELPPGQVLRTDVPKSPAGVGGAAFKGDRLAGWLSETQARGLLWTWGKVEGGSLVVQLPGGEGGLVGLQILGEDAEVSPSLEDGRVVMTVKIVTDADIADLGPNVPPYDARSRRELVAATEERMAQAVREEVLAALARARELRADIFGFGAVIHARLPAQWRKLKDRWDEEFPNLEVRVEVKARVRHTGRAVAGIEPR